jgi:Flp pilus assembly protein TadG
LQNRALMWRRLFTDRLGSTAVEFSILAPILIFATLGIIDGWSLASNALALRAGVKAAANYVLEGGQDDATIQTLALSAWESPPSDAAVAVQRVCDCAGSSSDCGSLCVNSKPPSMYVHIHATGTWTGPFTTNFLPATMALSREEVVRVR